MAIDESLTLDTKIRRLHKLKVEIEDAKTEMNKKIGERDSLLTTLRTQFGIKTRDEAKQKVYALDEQLKRRDQKIEAAFAQLAEKYEL